MAFPTGPVDNGTIYTDEYGNSFKYDANVGSWEKFTTGLGDPVYTTGATMEGDLVQSPSFDVRPQNPGELAINRVDDTKVQFKYMGDDFSTRGFEMDMGCTVDVMEPLLITSQTLDSGSAFVQFGDTLTIAQHAKIRGYSNTADTFIKWQRSDEIGDGASWSDIPGATYGGYEVLETDRGKFIRLVETFIPAGGGLCGSNYEVVSKPVLVTFQMPVVDYFVFTHEFGPGKLHLELSQQTEVYKAQNDGNWQLVENFAAGSRTLNLNAAQPGVYGVQSTGMTHFRFEDTNYLLEINIETSSKTPALTSLYRAFYDFGYFIQDVSFLDTSKVTNMAEMFALTQIYNAPVNFDVSNVTTAYRMFFDNRLFDNAPNNWYFPKLENANNMFYNCVRLKSGTFRFSDKLVNAVGMFQHCGEFNGTVNMNAASNCTNVSNMFYNCVKFTGSSGMNNWNTSKWQNTTRMFYNCRAFNQPIGNWNLTNVVNSYRMMANCRSYNQYWHNSWNMSNCENMASTFEMCTNLRVSVSGFNPNKCRDTNRMFEGCREVTGLGNWEHRVSNIENMALMFSGYKLENYNLRGLTHWYTPDVTNLYGFVSYSNVKVNIRNWCVSGIQPGDVEADFKFNNPLQSSYEGPQWGKCPPTFAFSTNARVINNSRPGSASGQGQAGDVLYADYSVSGASEVLYTWQRNASEIQGQQYVSNRTYTVTGSDVGYRIGCKVIARNSNGDESTLSLSSYTISADGMRAIEINPYTVVTTNSEDTGLPVRVKLRFTGTDSVPYSKMDDEGGFQQIGALAPNSDKILDLPSGIYQWEGTNMTVLDYSISAEGSEYVEWTDAYKDAVL